MTRSWLWKPVLRASPFGAVVAALAAPHTQRAPPRAKIDDRVQSAKGSGSQLRDIYLGSGSQSRIGPGASFDGLWSPSDRSWRSYNRRSTVFLPRVVWFTRLREIDLSGGARIVSRCDDKRDRPPLSHQILGW